jgi:transcriptional regulator with XRE-family HTH domain
MGMERAFGSILSGLRHARDLSQRKLAGDLHISQALLSHYENGTREPGLSFVCRVCDYFGISADFVLGRSGEEGAGSAPEAVAALLRALAERDGALREAALSYLNCAAGRVHLLLSAPNDTPALTEQAVLLMQAEHAVVQALFETQRSDERLTIPLE